jgi:thiol:disulfide interchange protein DsbD
LGLLAAFSGQVFGSLMTNPLVIVVLIALLLYLAGSMFGFYEMYIPKAVRFSGPQTKGGSYISAFVFGLVSGSVASPCLSPGLILLLSIVTTLGSKLLGFLLLFAFGIGLSLPLLLIVTFSSSLHILPRAGMWMIEVKHIFGFMLIGMCFYFLKPLVPFAILGWLITAFIISMALFYLYTGSRAHSKYMRSAKIIAGILLMASAVVTGAYTLRTDIACKGTIWRYDYEDARTHARTQNKLVLLGFGAPFCSLCTAIDNDMFQDPGVCSVLNNLECIKISADNDAPYVDELHKQYTIVGFPTYVLINPHTGAELKRWGSELYETPHCEFITEIEKLVAT